MNTSETAAQLSKWITEDIEVAQTHAAAEPPSSQHRLLAESLRQVVVKQATGSRAIKLLGIAQALLSSTFPFLTEPETARTFQDVIEFATAETSPEIRQRAFTVAALLLNRLRERIIDLPESTIDLINDALSATSSSQERSVLSAMSKRTEAAATRLRETRSKGPRKFNVPDLDVHQAARNVRQDAEGDWYQDPWGWPEVEWLGYNQPQKVMERLRSASCSWTVPIDVSKKDGGIRPGMVINPLDRIAFQSLADELSIEAASHLPSWVHGWRMARVHPTKGVYESNKAEWKLFSRRVVTLCRAFRFTAHLDIQAFFSTVDTSRLLSQLGRRYRNAAVLDRLENYFEAWHTCQNGLGIPQRSLASSVLAHAVLRPLDLYIDRLSSGGKFASFTASRWMDDIWLHSNNEKELRSCVTEIESALAQLRLSLNSEKTQVFKSEDAEAVVQLVDVYEENAEEDVAPTLRELLDEAEDAPPFRIGLEVAKLLGRKDFEPFRHISTDRWLRMGYLARSFAKAFRDSGEWKRFADTYIEFVHRHVSGENLTVASWAEMFPNNPEGEAQKVQELFSQHIVDDAQRILTPLAAQRLAAWRSRFGLGNLAELALLKTPADQSDIFRLRGIAFSALQAGISKDKVSAIAVQMDDDVIQHFLKDRNFEPPPTSARFQ
jgi:hypothetical protein